MPPDLFATTSLPWRERPLLPTKTTAEVLGCSRTKVYDLGAKGRLVLVNLDGKTLVRTESVLALLRSATPWKSSPRADKAVAARRTTTPARPV